MPYSLAPQILLRSYFDLADMRMLFSRCAIFLEFPDYGSVPRGSLQPFARVAIGPVVSLIWRSSTLVIGIICPCEKANKPFDQSFSILHSVRRKKNSFLSST
jgi:hypothetical protein